MKFFEPDTKAAKGWFTGAWDSDLAVNVGYANAGVDEPHYHKTVTEVYLVACGNATIRIDGQDIRLAERSVAIVEPGEIHTFLDSGKASLGTYSHIPVHLF